MRSQVAERPGPRPHVVVVGGGVVGLLTALEAVLAGAEVTVVEQGDLPNPGSTSHDRHRIVRALHPGDATATGTAALARDRWLDIERLLAAPLSHRVGALALLPTGEVAGAEEIAAPAGARTVALDGEQLARRYGHLRLPAGAAGVLERDALVVLADRAVAAVVRWLHAQPRARLCARRRVVRVDAATARAWLEDGTVVAGDRLVVAAGPWSRALLPEAVAARLVLHRQTVLYCRVPRRLAAGWRASPAVLGLGADGGTWLVPPVAGTPLKVSTAAASRVVEHCDGDTSPSSWREVVVDRCGEAVTGFDDAWVTGARDCHYLGDGVDGGPMVATLAPGTAWAFAACGGTSFKFAPLVALALVAAALAPEVGAPAADPFVLVATIATTTTGAPS